MEIRLNGASHQLGEARDLQSLVQSLELGQQAIAIAVNRQVITRSQWQQHVLQAGDQVDVVRAIGGG
ncbi:MAG: sulfur carrier protein ThiS [Burkholderiales bacterium]|nr:sulfur carrier protein ThiS [Burkholderiales bacterium]